MNKISSAHAARLEKLATEICLTQSNISLSYYDDEECLACTGEKLKIDTVLEALYESDGKLYLSNYDVDWLKDRKDWLEKPVWADEFSQYSRITNSINGYVQVTLSKECFVEFFKQPWTSTKLGSASPGWPVLVVTFDNVPLEIISQKVDLIYTLLDYKSGREKLHDVYELVTKIEAHSKGSVFFVSNDEQSISVLGDSKIGELLSDLLRKVHRSRDLQDIVPIGWLRDSEPN